MWGGVRLILVYRSDPWSAPIVRRPGCRERSQQSTGIAKQSRKTVLDIFERYVEGNIALFGAIWMVKMAPRSVRNARAR